MERATADVAICNLLRDLGAKVDEPVSIYKIGEPLIIDKGYSEDELINALFYLQSQKVIDLLEGNRLRLCKPL
ncbi:hypothetical protein [Neorhizobium alkalisoli]|uniref:Uncharacterized protein n=1 Tax=Neorhizobium alkalisoli TaxID=528178 RepID=A0A561QHR6_9HYPH|nr:hypothetical protein [Neorhizobium alkalisoli]TWF49897.1 hypothetical protein FHW37_107268 [Neorhizobium alkalisoli]